MGNALAANVWESTLMKCTPAKPSTLSSCGRIAAFLCTVFIAFLFLQGLLYGDIHARVWASLIEADFDDALKLYIYWRVDSFTDADMFGRS